MDPFEHLRQQLDHGRPATEHDEIRPDRERSHRSGTPEVILAGTKSTGQIVASVQMLIASRGRVIVSRLTSSRLDELREAFADTFEIAATAGDRAALVSHQSSARVRTSARVAVITAGTSDVAIAAEAVLMAEEMGCDVRTAWDVGVAGIHRLVGPLEQLSEWDPDAYVVAAGMDGILPTVITGLVLQPVIGLPVSTGYGFGGEGLGALTTMLQSCAPGMSVVNIDNGIGAGAMAALIANRAAHFRAMPPQGGA